MDTEKHIAYIATARVGEKIRYYRKKRGLTQEQLATVCNKNASTVRNYELGNRTPNEKVIVDIATALNISPFVLLEPSADNARSAIQFLFALEKTFLLKPTCKDNKILLEAQANRTDFYEYLKAWADSYNKMNEKEISYEEYLEWQSSRMEE